MRENNLGNRRLQPIARAIERREKELLRRVAEERERAHTEELADASGDTADQAFARIELGFEYQRIDACLAEIRALAAARERLQNGTFGVCVDCGEPIEHARLAAAPAVARCAHCQDRYEHVQAVRH